MKRRTRPNKSLDPTVNRSRLHYDFTAIYRSRFVALTHRRLSFTFDKKFTVRGIMPFPAPLILVAIIAGIGAMIVPVYLKLINQSSSGSKTEPNNSNVDDLERRIELLETKVNHLQDQQVKDEFKIEAENEGYTVQEIKPQKSN